MPIISEAPEITIREIKREEAEPNCAEEHD